jgi:hypothetical protein
MECGRQKHRRKPEIHPSRTGNINNAQRIVTLLKWIRKHVPLQAWHLAFYLDVLISLSFVSLSINGGNMT